MLSLSQNNICIVVPVFNESVVIKKVVEELAHENYSIIVVDDGSAIKIAPVINGIPGIYTIRHKVNLGQGAALQTGISFALKLGASYIVTFDGDGQHSVADIPAMLYPLQQGDADITLASRFIRKGSHNASRGRQWVLKTGRLVNYFFTGIALSDSHNGLRAMNRQAAEKVQLKENRMAHATEILFAIRKYKLRYREVPASVLYTDYSKNKGQSVLNSIRIFFDLVLHKLFE